MTNAKRRRLWRDRVSDYRASDLTVRAWCEKNWVTENRLRYWLARIDEESPASERCEVEPGTEGHAWGRVEIVEDPSAVERRRLDWLHRCFGISGAHRPLRQPIPICSGLGFHTGAI